MDSGFYQYKVCVINNCKGSLEMGLRTTVGRLRAIFHSSRYNVGIFRHKTEIFTRQYAIPHSLSIYLEIAYLERHWVAVLH